MVVVGGLVSGEWCLVVRSGQDCATSQGLDGQVVVGGCDDPVEAFFQQSICGMPLRRRKGWIGYGSLQKSNGQPAQLIGREESQ